MLCRTRFSIIGALNSPKPVWVLVGLLYGACGSRPAKSRGHHRQGRGANTIDPAAEYHGKDIIGTLEYFNSTVLQVITVIVGTSNCRILDFLASATVLPLVDQVLKPSLNHPGLRYWVGNARTI